MSDFLQVSAAVLASVKNDDYAGYDPFDSLNSRFLKATPLYNSELVRLAWLQLGKRSPINLRPILGVPKKRNPKGVALFILGLLEDYQRTGDEVYLEDAKLLGDWLLSECCDANLWGHACWGYHFDWQARAFYVPVGKPNIITTVYVARGLYNLGEITGEKRYANAAYDAAYFIHKHLLADGDGDGDPFFAYIPGESAFVHNASLWGAAWVGFVGAQLGDEKLSKTALEVARHSKGGQKEDGSWVYGLLHHHQFIDGFHTGYNLEALSMLSEAQKTDEFNACIAKGLDFYRSTFFLSDGTAKYYDNNVYPLDMHSFSQAVFTFLRVGGTQADFNMAETVLERALKVMYLPDKAQFVYQKTPWIINRINYTRWTQAWAYYALSFFNRYRSDGTIDNEAY
jgi:polysaccharide biosynthesis protein VpsJ